MLLLCKPPLPGHGPSLALAVPSPRKVPGGWAGAVLVSPSWLSLAGAGVGLAEHGEGLAKPRVNQES